jgi:UDP-N-acetylmuramoyl-L-alanyl-D-glutamate--2,6-diaminopimelate ligase
VIVDYAHNESSFSEVIGLARRLYGGRITTVFGSVGERSLGRRAELAGVSEKMSDFSVITADNSGREETLSICSQIYSEYKDKTLARVIPDRREAIKYALSTAHKGDTVLLLGMGHERSHDGLSDGEFVDRINNI